MAGGSERNYLLLQICFKHHFVNLSSLGINGSLNGNSTTAVSALSTSMLSTSIATLAGPVKTITSGAGGRKYNQEQSKVQLLDTRADKIKDKVSTQKETEDSGKKFGMISVLHTGVFFSFLSKYKMFWVLLIYWSEICTLVSTDIFCVYWLLKFFNCLGIF